MYSAASGRTRSRSRSLAWSTRVPQTVDEAERALVYVAGAAAFLLATRLFPNELSADGFGGYRLSTPVGYWNGLGVLAATGASETPLG